MKNIKMDLKKFRVELPHRMILAVQCCHCYIQCELVEVGKEKGWRIE